MAKLNAQLLTLNEVTKPLAYPPNDNLLAEFN